MFSRKAEKAKKCEKSRKKVQVEEWKIDQKDGLESLERRPSRCLFREMFIKEKSVDPEVWILKMMSDAILHNVHTSKTKTCESVMLSVIW